MTREAAILEVADKTTYSELSRSAEVVLRFHSFSFSYTINWTAPCETPNMDGSSPRKRPCKPSCRAIFTKPSERLRYASGVSAFVEDSIRVLTTHMGFVHSTEAHPARADAVKNCTDPKSTSSPLLPRIACLI